MKNKLYEVFRGDDIITLSDEKQEPIIDGMLYHNDYVMIVAEEKTGKTIMAQQIACCCTTGSPLLGIFDIPKPVNVMYIATEGRAEDLKDRFIRMRNGVGLDTSKIQLISSSFRFNTQEGIQSIKELIEMSADVMPKVVIIDALYRAIRGSIKNDDAVNEFQHIIGWLIMQLDCAVILVHHLTKAQRNQEGNYVPRTDKDAFGSVFLRAAVDHCFWLEKDYETGKKEDRVLKCDTQRSGKIPSMIKIKLNQPDPLYFTTREEITEDKARILALLKSYKDGLTMFDLEVKSNVSRSRIYQVLRDLKMNRVITVIGNRNKVYKI